MARKARGPSRRAGGPRRGAREIFRRWAGASLRPHSEAQSTRFRVCARRKTRRLPRARRWRRTMRPQGRVRPAWTRLRRKLPHGFRYGPGRTLGAGRGGGVSFARRIAAWGARRGGGFIARGGIRRGRTRRFPWCRRSRRARCRARLRRGGASDRRRVSTQGGSSLWRGLRCVAR